MLVAVIVGHAGINTLLVISQVVLSIVLPFVMFPLIWLTSSSVVMRVSRPRQLVQDEATTSEEEVKSDEDEKTERPSAKDTSVVKEFSESAAIESGDDILDSNESEEAVTQANGKEGKGRGADVAYVESIATPLAVGDTTSEYIDYSNGWPLTILSYGIWLVILIANGYVIVTLAID